MKKIILSSLGLILAMQLYAFPYNGLNHDSTSLVHDSTCYFIWDPGRNQWIDSLKQIFIYDENHNLLGNSCYLWIPESGVWTGCDDFGHQTWKYDENGNLTEHLKYKWDQGKGDWVLSCGLRKELIYDASGRIIQEVLSNCFSDEENWIFSKKTTCVFNTDGLLTEKSCYLWNNQLLEWEGDNSQFHQTLSYNQNGDITRHIYYHWNRETKEWVAFSQFEWNYDENGKIIEKIQWKWNTESMKWIGVMRYTWKYYSSPDMIEEILYNWLSNLSTWYPTDLNISIYNESGKITEHCEYIWDYVNSKWVSHGQQCIYFYDENGNITNIIDYHWSETLNEWVKFSCLRIVYDESGNKTDSCIYYWDTETESWTGKIGYNYLVSTYDTNGNPTEIVCHQWDTLNRCWNYLNIELIQYDEDGKQTEWAKYAWDSISDEWTGSCKECINIANNPCFMIIDKCGRITNSTELISNTNNRREIKTEIHFQWDFENKTWDYSWKVVEYWSELDTDVSETNTLKTNGCIVYPNPFTEYTFVILPESEIIRKIELIDSFGRTVRIINSLPERSIRIDRDNLPGGIYFIRIHSDEIYVKKVIIQ